MAANPKGDYFSSLHKRNTISSRAKLGDKEKENIPPQVIKDKSKQPITDKNKEARVNGGNATISNLSLAAMFREKLLIDEPKEPPKSTKPVSRSRSRSKTLKQNSSKETNLNSGGSCNIQDAHDAKLRKTRPRSSSRHSIQGMLYSTM